MKAGCGEQARLDRAMRHDMEHAKSIRARTDGTGLVGSVSREALMNAVRTEGRGVLTREGRGYWDDMARLYPWTNLSGRRRSGESLNGHRNRFGRVSARSRWDAERKCVVREKWEKGRFVEVGEWRPGKRGEGTRNSE